MSESELMQTLDAVKGNTLPPLGTKTIGYTKEGRPIIKNPDGSVSTERTATFQIGEQWVNVPTMYGGKEVSQDEALDIARKNWWFDPETGKPFKAFKSLKEAETAARKRSQELDDEMKAMGIYGR